MTSIPLAGSGSATAGSEGPRQAGRGTGALSGAVVLLLGTLPGQWAQAAEPAEAGALAEVVVTAQKRSESVLDVPLSMTAIDDHVIERAGITDFMDYALKAPNLTFSYSEGQGSSVSRSIAIRGIQGAGTTGFYVDDLPLPSGVDPHALDLARIEVLRGPQGTLYGARSMGGTVRLITQSPDTSTVSGFAHGVIASMEAAGMGTYQAEAGINMPLRQDLAVRLNAFSSSDAGFENRRFPDPAAPGTFRTVDDVGRVDEYGGSATLLWTPTDALSIRPLLIYQHAHRNGLPLADYTADNRIQQRLYDIPEQTLDEWTIAGLTMSLHTGIGDLTAATSYFNRRVYEFEEGSDVTALLLNFSPPISTGIPTWEPQREFVEEVRFASNLHGPVQFVTGVYYASSTQGFIQNWVVPGLGAVNGGEFGTDLAYISYNPFSSRDKAVFGDLSYSLTSQWTATVGLRYSDTHGRFTRTADGIFNGGPSFNEESSDEKSTTPKFLIKYQPDADQDYYALAAKGFRPGGPNGPLPDQCGADLAALGVTFDDVKSFKADSVWNYEIGAKTRLLNHRLGINAALFWIDWTGIQQLVRLPTCGFQYQGNAGAARSRGAELELSAAPLTGLSVSLGVGYTDAKITEASPNVSVFPGEPVQQVAPWTVSAAAEYDVPLRAGWQGVLRADNGYVDHSFSASNDQLHPRLRQSYDILNLRAGVTSDVWEVFVFVNNATNARPNLADNESQLAELPGRPRILTSLPRTGGIDVRVRF